MLLEIFQYEFMVRALIVGFFTAVTTAILGNFIVTARQAVVSDMLAHTALVGVGFGVLWDFYPTYLALVATIFSALGLWYLNRIKPEAPEANSMLLLSGGLALALLLTHLNKNNPIALNTYLFGSILTITKAELWSFVFLNIAIVFVICTNWNRLLTLVFDPDYTIHPRQKNFYEILFMLLIACMVGIGLKVIGGLLIGALFVIPVLTVSSFTRSFYHTVLCSIAVNIVGVFLGIISSFYLDIPTSSAIILSLIGFYLLGRFFRRLFDFSL
jgi:zinc transport system permease protein